MRSVGEARCLSFVAGVGVLLFAVPSILIGAQSTVAGRPFSGAFTCPFFVDSSQCDSIFVVERNVLL